MPVEAGVDVGRVSRQAASTAARLGFSPAGVARVERVAADLAARLLAHGAGRVVVRVADEDGRPEVELLLSTTAVPTPSGYAFDGDLDAPGADVCLVYPAPGKGTVAMARVSDRPPTDLSPDPKPDPTPDPSGRPFLVGSCSEPIPEEVVSGDAWAVEQEGDRLVVLVADGLGHGEQAAAASGAAVAAFAAHHPEPVERIVARLHDALRQTRGAAVAVAEVDLRTGQLRFAGIGNITARLLTEDGAHELVSRFGIAGYQAPVVRTVTRPWPEDAMLVMHTDGLSSRWQAAAYPRLRQQHPQLVASTVMRDAVRAHDDALVAAVRADTGTDARRWGAS